MPVSYFQGTAVLETRLSAARALLLDTLGSYGRLSFYDEFNSNLIDTNIWMITLDGTGSLVIVSGDPSPSGYRFTTGNAIDEDAGIHGAGVIHNKMFSPAEEGYTTVTATFRVKLIDMADVSVLLGLFTTGLTDYAEPISDCVQFLIDPAITNTFRARSYDAAEEETDTLVALDTAWHTFRIEWAAASVLFYIDDVLVATHAVQVPGQVLIPSILIRTEANAIKRMDIDYVRVEVT